MTPMHDHLRALVEVAVAQGRQLLAQAGELQQASSPFALQLDPRPEFSQQAQGFFGRVEIDGAPRTALGCRHQLHIGPGLGPDSPEALRDFVYAKLLTQAATTDHGRTGGFTVYRLTEDRAAAPAAGAVDWRRLGDPLPWAALSVELHDFELRLGPIVQRPRQMVWVVQHPAFVNEDSHPEPDVIGRITVGYPFLPHAPLPNPFGFGPGKFGAAIKLFTFTLCADLALKVEMVFLAAPRCEKVFDVLGLPDPVFGGLAVMEALSFGAFRAQPHRDRLEAIMLETHCRVHAAFIAGFVRRWRTARGLTPPSIDPE